MKKLHNIYSKSPPYEYYGAYFVILIRIRQYNFLSFIFGHKALSIRMLGMPPLITSDKESKKGTPN